MFKLLKLKSLDYQLVSSGSQKSAQAPATLQGVEYKCQIINNILNIHLSQNFVSKSDNEYSETIYYFPIQEGICLESFEAKYNEKTIKAIVKEKDQAKKEYSENKSQGNFVTYAQTTSVQDQEYCQIELGNLPPGQQVEIKIVFSQQLNTLLNKYFVAHIPLVYCEDEVSVKLGKNVLTLDLFCTGKILYAESKGYPAEKIMVDDNTARFNLSQAFLQQNTDFQLIFSYEGMFDPQVIFGSSQIFNEDSVKSAILPTSHSAMVSFIPNFNEEITQDLDDSIRAAINNGDDIFSDEFQQKLNQELIDHLNSSRSEFIFLLDRSGSMSGQPIRRACEALTLFLKSLPNDSYFNVISFGSSFEKLFPQSAKYTSDSLEKAIYLISSYQADLGGTEIYNPLNNVFVQNKISGYNKQIFLLTDGEVDSPQQVVRLIKKNSKYNRVHSIGFGSGADQYLIKESAIAGKGISKLVDQKCDLSEVIINMLSLCITPTFDEFKITYDQSIFDSTFPSCTNFPCVFKDEIINIHFFFKPTLDLQSLTEQQKKISIEYYDSHKKQKVQKEIKLEMQDSFTCNPQLQQSVFKIGKQLYLNENILDEISNSQLTQQAIDYQLLTKKTALICVIETLNDEQKIMYQNVNHNKTYQNSSSIPNAPSLSLSYQSQLNAPISYSHSTTHMINPAQQQFYQKPSVSSPKNSVFDSNFDDPFVSLSQCLNAPIPPPPTNFAGYNPPSAPSYASLNLCQNIPVPAPSSNFGCYNLPSAPAPPTLNISQNFSVPPPPPPRQSLPSSYPHLPIGGICMNQPVFTTSSLTQNIPQQQKTNQIVQSNNLDKYASFGNKNDKPLLSKTIPQKSQLQFSKTQRSSSPNQQQIPQQEQSPYEEHLDLEEELISMDCEFLQASNQTQPPPFKAMSSSNDVKGKMQEELFQINSIIENSVNQIKSQNASLAKISNTTSQLSLPKLEDLLNIVNSQGIWKFDDNLIMKLSKTDQNTIKQFCSYFASSDAFMTLFILLILEINYGQQKSKWVLISKKSLNYVKSQLNEGQDFNTVKQNIQSIISN
ncbi:hypothetical protein ABPG74_002692 [Tetrahymena malaccensis]